MMTVDSLCGGDGRLALRAKGRDITRTEQRYAVNAPVRDTGK